MQIFLNFIASGLRGHKYEPKNFRSAIKFSALDIGLTSWVKNEWDRLIREKVKIL